MTARWTDEAGPHEVRLPPILGSPLVWPAEPKKLWPVTPDFPAALHEAGKTAARETPNRYATDHVQVRGKAGQVIGTDGKQALTVGGFAFPFPDDLLVPAVPVFGCKDLGRERAVSLGVGHGLAVPDPRPVAGLAAGRPAPAGSRTSPPRSRRPSRPGSRSPTPTPTG